MRKNRNDISGLSFNCLTAIRYVYSRKGKELWEFKCECGNTTISRKGDVMRGRSKSCGCKTSELIAQSKIKHGLVRHPLYNIWSGMKDRCYNKNNIHYDRYGGRGIIVCDRWRLDFKAFYDDMIKYYVAGFSIDRINNDGNYEPTNCRFSDSKQQNLNNSSNRRIKSNLGDLTVSEISERTGLYLHTVFARANSKYKDKDITRPVGLKINTEWGFISRKEAAERSGLNYRTLKSRIQLGWPEEKLLIPLRRNKLQKLK